MKEKKSSFLFWLWGCYFIMALLCVYLSFDSKASQESIVINAGMFIIVGLVFFRTSKRFKELKTISSEFINAADKIRTDFDANVNLWEKYKSEAESLFDNAILNAKYKEFVSEETRFEGITEGNYRCKIDDFINRGLLDSIVKKNLCNLVAGAMTGLGILGTFIGLSFGLQEFNTGSAEEISDSIAPLMDGIKIAFHTSIYGMVFSLVFNLIYKTLIENSYNALEEFLNCYDGYVLRDSEYSNESEAFNLIRKLPEEIGENISNTLTPAMEEISQTFKQFAEDVSTNQLEGLSSIVDSFIEEMNTSLGGQFQRLGEILEKTCDMQEKNNEYMQGLLEKVGGMVTDIDKINEMSSSTVEKMSAYVEKLDECQGKINESLNGMNEQIDKQTAINDQLRENMESLSEQQKQILEVTSKVSGNLEEQIHNLSEFEKGLSEETRANMEMLVTQAKDYSQQLTDFEKEQMENIEEISEKQIDIVKKASENLSDQVQDYSQQLTDFEKSQMEKMHSFSEEQISTIRKVSDEYVAQTQNYNQQLADFAIQQMDKMAEFSKGQTANMQAASEELSRVTKDLNSKLKESLTETFKCFDSNLSEITEHLSGTISEVDETTKRVPSVVNAAYSGMEKSFKQMQQKIDSLTNAVGVVGTQTDASATSAE